QVDAVRQCVPRSLRTAPARFRYALLCTRLRAARPCPPIGSQEHPDGAGSREVETMSDQPNGPVVVGVDGSEEAIRAALYAAWEAERRRVPLRIVCAHQPAPPWSPSIMIADEAWEEGWLRDQLTRARSAVMAAYPDLSIQTRAEIGSVPWVLVN